MNVSKYTTIVIEHMITSLRSKKLQYDSIPQAIIKYSSSYLLSNTVLIALKDSINNLILSNTEDDLGVFFDSFTWSTSTGIVYSSNDLLFCVDEDNLDDVVLNILSCYVTWLVMYCLSVSDNLKWLVEISIKTLYVKTILYNVYSDDNDINNKLLMSRVDKLIDYFDYLLVKHGHSISNLLLFCKSIFRISSENYINGTAKDKELSKIILRGVFGTLQSAVLFNYSYRFSDTITNRRVVYLNRISDSNVDNLLTAFLAVPYFPESRDEKNIVGIGFLDIAIRNIILGGEKLAKNYGVDYSKIEKSLLAADSEVSRVWTRYIRTVKDPAFLNRHLMYIRKLYYSVDSDTLNPYVTFMCIYGFVENLISNYKLEKITKLSTRLNKAIMRNAVHCVRDAYKVRERDTVGITRIIGTYIENVYPNYYYETDDLVEYILKSRLYSDSAIHPNTSETTDINRVIVIIRLLEMCTPTEGVPWILGLESCIPGYEDCRINRLTLEECAVEIYNRIVRIDNTIYTNIPRVDTVIIVLLALNSDRGLLNTKFFRPVINSLISPEEETKPGYLYYLYECVKIFYQVINDSRMDEKTFAAKMSLVRCICNRTSIGGDVYLTLCDVQHEDESLVG